MKIIIIGGTGLIGSKLAPLLEAKGHEAVPASPSSGVDTISGEGLHEALSGADVVVDVSNLASFEDDKTMEFFTKSSENLLAAEAETGVGHHVALSVVGTQRLPEVGYYRAKVAQENLITASPIPYSIVHATQFFEFAGTIAAGATDGDEIHLPPILVQPIAADDVAAALAEAATNPPLNGNRDIAGPDQLTMTDWIARSLASIDDPRTVVPDPEADFFGARLDERALVPHGEAELGGTGLDEWLEKVGVSLPG